MSFQSEVAPRNTASSSRMKEMSDRDRVMESSVTWRMESELITGMKRKTTATTMIP